MAISIMHKSGHIWGIISKLNKTQFLNSFYIFKNYVKLNKLNYVQNKTALHFIYQLEHCSK